MKRKILALSIFITVFVCAFAQNPNSDSAVIRRIFDESLLRGKSYEMLGELCEKAPHRLSGSKHAEIAVEWAKAKMESLGFDSVFLQPVMVPHWVRGEKEDAKIISKAGKKKVNICALGGSVGTGKKGIRAQVVEVKGLDELEKLGREKVEGKIVFYSRPMDARHILTFHAYGGCVDQRVWGASEASKYGALGVIVRSMNLRTDEYPHTGAMAYKDSVTKIPAAAISTLHADQLSHMLQNEPNLEFYFKMNCETLPDVLSYNVIGEMRGSEYPNEYIVAGGHLDAWDNGDGAHDDGAGSVQSIEAVRLFMALNKRPKRTLRAVLFMNEENGLRGARRYAEIADSLKTNHIAAIESDAGGFSPRGFRLNGNDAKKEKVRNWQNLLIPYGLHDYRDGYGGADIGQLKGVQEDILLAGFMPDSQRYFDYHHANIDTFDAVNKRELELGAASIAALMYLMSEYGF